MNTDIQPARESWIVVVGRANIAKSSRSLERMIRSLRASGYCVQNLEPRQSLTSRLMNRWFDGLLNGRIARVCRRYKTPGGWLRKAAKAVWLAFHPALWDFSRFSKTKRTQNEERAADLRALLRYWRGRHPSRQVYLFAHSAGGIVSSWLEGEPNVVGLVCFGYPFKHPKRREEAFRTEHLKHMRKPFLIIQGSMDEYGTRKDARRYELSPSVRIVPVPANHNYDGLSPKLFRRCLKQVARHFGDAAGCR